MWALDYGPSAFRDSSSEPLSCWLFINKLPVPSSLCVTGSGIRVGWLSCQRERDKIKYSCSGQNVTASRDLFRLRAPMSICLYIMLFDRYIRRLDSHSRVRSTRRQKIFRVSLSWTRVGRVCLLHHRWPRTEMVITRPGHSSSFVMSRIFDHLITRPGIAWLLTLSSQAWTARSLRSMEAFMRLHKVWWELWNRADRLAFVDGSLCVMWWLLAQIQSSVYRCDRIVSGRVPTSYRIVTLIWIVKWV